jgi:ketosteroid isomerase-like protein
MSQENVQVVLDQFAATNERDFAKAMGYYAEDVELFVDPEAFLSGGTYRGRADVGKWFADWLTTFEPGYRFEIQEARELGDAVFLHATHSGRGKASGAEVQGETAYLYRVTDGKIDRVALYAGPAEALAAAGARD